MPIKDDNSSGAHIVQLNTASLSIKAHAGVVKTAVDSVALIAPHVVQDAATATAIKNAVRKLDHHDLAAVRDGIVPDHVSNPKSENEKALARAYAGAELADRARKSEWWKSWIGWAVTLGVAVLTSALTFLFTRPQ